MKLVPIPDIAARQTIDAFTIWAEYLRTRSAAGDYLGGLYWKKERGYEYLVKTAAGQKPQRIGPRSTETEETYTTFYEQKKAVEGRLRFLKNALEETQRLNKAVRAGRTPNLVVKVLTVLSEAGLGAHLRVLGTYALYAFETLAGVRVVPETAAQQEAELFSDAGQAVEFLADPQLDMDLVLALLQKVDATFQRRPRPETVVFSNSKGFNVELFCSASSTDEFQPDSSSFNQDVPPLTWASWAEVLWRTPPFSQSVISTTGKIANMNVIDPRVFVALKRWQAIQTYRHDVKRIRDVLQADVVREMLEASLIRSAIQR